MERVVYRVSKRRMIVAVVAATSLLAAALPMRSDASALMIGGGPLVLALLWVGWASALEYRLSADGVTRSSRFSTVSLRWDQLDEVWYRGEKRSVNLVPLGTYVTLWLRDLKGQTMTISGGGNYFGYLVVAPSSVDSLQAAVLRSSSEPLLKRLRSRLESSESVALGAVALSHQTGITVHRMIGTSRSLPLSSLAGVGVHDGYLYFFERGAKRSLAPVPVAKVANVGPLVALLKGLGVPEIAMSAGFLGPSAR